MGELYDELHKLAQTEGNEPIRCSRMHFSEWADDVDKLDAEIKRLREGEIGLGEQQCTQCRKISRYEDTLSHNGLCCDCAQRELDMYSAIAAQSGPHLQQLYELLRVRLKDAEEIERLRASEAELFDKCGELQRKVWQLEGRAAAGGGDG